MAREPIRRRPSAAYTAGLFGIIAAFITALGGIGAAEVSSSSDYGARVEGLRFEQAKAQEEKPNEACGAIFNLMGDESPNPALVGESANRLLVEGVRRCIGLLPAPPKDVPVSPAVPIGPSTTQGKRP